jgi:hypothetical protein
LAIYNLNNIYRPSFPKEEPSIALAETDNTKKQEIGKDRKLARQFNGNLGIEDISTRSLPKIGG